MGKDPALYIQVEKRSNVNVFLTASTRVQIRIGEDRVERGDQGAQGVGTRGDRVIDVSGHQSEIVKTRGDGGIIHAQGVPPTYSKPTTEFLLVATTTKGGRPVKLLSSRLPQVVLAPREGHSVKPALFRRHIEDAFGPGPDKIELFARARFPGWDAIGDAVCGGEDIRTSIDRIVRGEEEVQLAGGC